MNNVLVCSLYNEIQQIWYIRGRVGQEGGDERVGERGEGREEGEEGLRRERGE